MPLLYPCSLCGAPFQRRGRETRCTQHVSKPWTGATSRGFPTYVRRAILERDGNRCVWCGSTTNLEADHIIPAAFGGSDNAANGRALCRPCHRKATQEASAEGRRRKRAKG